MNDTANIELDASIELAFPTLVKATFIKRVNRFIAEVELNGNQILVHVPTTGRMDTVLKGGQLCFLKPANNPLRKTRFSLFLVEIQNSMNPNQSTLVCIDAIVANQFTKLLLTNNMLDDVPNETIRAEVTYDKDRLDFVVYESNCSKVVEHLIEVKSVNMCLDGIAYFPDAPTLRGQKHLRSLIEKQQTLHLQTHVVFIIQRNDAVSFSPCIDRDPAFSMLLKEAYEKGTCIHVCLTDVSATAMTFTSWLPVCMTTSRI